MLQDHSEEQGSPHRHPLSSPSRTNQPLASSPRHGASANLADPRPSSLGKRTSRSADRDDEDSRHSGNGRSASPSACMGPARIKGTRRLPQACIRCRQKKMRCPGGTPCPRCDKARAACIYGRTPTEPPSSKQDPPGDVHTRLRQLESSIGSFLAGFSSSKDLALGGAVSAHTSQTPQAHGFSGDAFNDFMTLVSQHTPQLDTSSAAALLQQPNSASQPSFSPTQSFSGPPMQEPEMMPWLVDPASEPLSSSTQAPDPYPWTANTANQPSQQVAGASVSALPRGGGTAIPSPTVRSTGTAVSKGLNGSEEHRTRGKDSQAEARLAMATDEPFEAPFKALIHQPSVWDNRERSRATSPQQSRPLSRDGTNGIVKIAPDKDDPITLGLLDIGAARTLFQFYVEHCHPFMPVINIALPDAFSKMRQSPYLISTILAIAGRFYTRYCQRSGTDGTCLDTSMAAKLTNLAERHLCQTMMRKEHALPDVQATILLAVWCLQSGGKGPDSWIVTGHAYRMTKRLGIPELLCQNVEERQAMAGDPAASMNFERMLPQWRTWLCWLGVDGFLSLGYGRPQSTTRESADGVNFVKDRLGQDTSRPGTSGAALLHGDVYLAGQVELIQIARDIVDWRVIMAHPEREFQSDPLKAMDFRKRDLSLKAMLKEFNGRLDKWAHAWVWSGSPYATYLGASARVARLQAEHMRLCLNSFALKDVDGYDEALASYLNKALNAARSTIQEHWGSSQSDLALSFAADYLTIALAQAAVFLIRLTKAPDIIREVVGIEIPVISHYIKMSIELLTNADLSETRLATYLAQMVADIAQAAGVTVNTRTPSDLQSATGLPSPRSHVEALASNVQQEGQQADLGLQEWNSLFNADDYIRADSQGDLGYLLGLPADNSAFGGLTFDDPRNEFNGFSLGFLNQAPSFDDFSAANGM